MKLTPLLIVCAGLFIGCDRQQASSSNALPPRATEQQPLELNGPGTVHFDVTVGLSKGARKTLKDGHETIIVAVWISGDPKKGANPKDIGEEGIELAHRTREIPGEGTVRFSELLPAELMVQTDGSGLKLQADAYSGRKSSTDNLLDCGGYWGKLSADRSSSVRLECKLIGEK